MKKYRLFQPMFRALLAVFTLALLVGCGKNACLQTPQTFSAAGNAIASAAQSQLGKSYRKGGISPESGFDCSGLVYWSCAQSGIAVPRLSRDQAHSGHEIHKSALRPGDIVVFKVSWFSYHTGIYIGGGRFVHSPKPRSRVQIESLNHIYWKKHFVTGRRVTLP